jgi:hypothetical protein
MPNAPPPFEPPARGLSADIRNVQGFDAETLRQDDQAAKGRRHSGGRKLTIILRIGETERAVNEMEAALLASGRKLYQRSGLIVSTSSMRLPTWEKKMVTVQVIEERGDHALIEDIEAVAKFVRLDAKGKPIPAPPPMALIKTLKDRKHRLRFPVIVGVVNCPSITVDGKLLDEPGFDPETGILFDPLGVTFPPVPDHPTRLMAEAALARLLRMIETFDFVGDDDKAVALSLFLTVIARRGLPTAPVHAFDAPTAGVGKSMIVDIASILATGHEAGVTALGETREEAEKRLASTLMRGDPVIAMDNCELPLEGVLINQCLTQQRVELRILGKSKIFSAATSAAFSATGNNLVVKGDLTRRAVVGRLDPKVARPELRQFPTDPIAEAKRDRGELVVAALTVLKAYHVAGRPKRPKPPLGSFVDWSNTVRGALLWLGCGDPVRTQDRLREKDPTLVALIAALAAWRDEFGDEPTAANKAASAANATLSKLQPGTINRYVEEPTHPGLRNALMAVAGRGGKVDVGALGQWLGKSADRVVDLGDGSFVVLKMVAIVRGTREWAVKNAHPSGDKDDDDL